MVYYELFSLLLVGAQCVNVHRERLSINTVHVQKLFTDKSRPVYLQCALLCSKVWILSSTWLSAWFYLDVPLEILCPQLLSVLGWHQVLPDVRLQLS